MKLDEVFKIANANPTNKFITQHLDEQTLESIIGILEKLNASDFREINPNGAFEFGDIPIPYRQLTKTQNEQTTFSTNLQEHFGEVLKSINTEGTNIEYPFVIRSEENSSEYSKLKPFENGTSQTCQYDWAWIEDYIKNSDKKIKLSLLHTHPNPLDKQHNTLYNKYPEQLGELGVQPNGLNISLADIYAGQYLQMLAEKYGKEIDTESTILMYDGTLISFTTQNGITLTSERNLEKYLQANVVPKIEPVSKEELEKAKKELYPETLSTTTPTQNHNNHTLSREIEVEEKSL